MVMFRILCCFISCSKIKPSSSPPQVVEKGKKIPPSPSPQVAKINKKKPSSSSPQGGKTYNEKPRPPRRVVKEQRIQLLI
ncbi:unnamed protein product [Arabidopsis thaliana]|uniref:Uncharacterized protein n=1 Tax=Arabidopsis thaliana TaxID=3702 RepID=A0A5S9WLJ5_ARATH|nr:unnamed protein product [Arabidopsis thaliana]VYS49007.1 unnamed protein product [Arabidopsis thaliana]